MNTYIYICIFLYNIHEYTYVNIYINVIYKYHVCLVCSNGLAAP